MIIDGEDLGFVEEVTLGGHFAGTSTGSKAFILENLEFITVGRFNIGNQAGQAYVMMGLIREL